MALDKRQKILLPLIILAFAYIAWQIYDLFFSDLSNATQSVVQTISPVQTETNIMPQTPASTASISQVSTAPKESLLESKKNPILQLEKKERQEGPVITAEQSEYLRLVNRYNLLKLKHMLLEEEAAIAAAKQRIIKSRSEISNLGGHSDWIGEDELDFSGVSSKLGYELVYLDYQNGRWNALLNKSGRFFEVYTGIQLMNGDKIITVSKEGVIIRHKDQFFQLTFDGSRAISEEEISTITSTMATQAAMVGGSDPKDGILETGVETGQTTLEQEVSLGRSESPAIQPALELNKKIAVPFQAGQPSSVIGSPMPEKSKAAGQSLKVDKIEEEKVSVQVKTPQGKETVKQIENIQIQPTVISVKINGLEKQKKKGSTEKLSHAMEKVQKWFSGLWSHRSEPKASGVSRSTSQWEKKTNQPESLPEPTFLKVETKNVKTLGTVND